MTSIFERVLGRGDFMETFTGRKYYPCAPHVEDVQIADIAHHLSMICRYTGACRRFYSVAEHSVLVSTCVSPTLALGALMHDATEAYLTDINRALKYSPLMRGYRLLEERNWRVIAEKFGLPLVLDEEIKYADNAVLLAEREAIMPDTGTAWNIPAEPAHVFIRCLPPDEAEAAFLNRFYALTSGVTQARLIFPPRPCIPTRDAVFA